MTTFEKVKFQTSRLILRPLQETDAPALLAIFSDEKVMQYWSTPPWNSIEIAEALIARDLKAMAAGGYIRLGIERAEDHILIGNCTLFDLDKQCRRAEIGYGMAHSAWGKGYMHEALSALLDFGFSELKLNRIEADIDPRNLASAKSLERLGFSREGYLRERWIVDGVVSDTALYGLLVSDWHDRLKSNAQ
ncbi:GNAT family N-acetyltransferase [Iodobacter fluviatilis]|uniref:Ribosomal N-acetyltransferase YdaF n=1 Tax=Iodobacter fluviatilis TaxID=537 RepID=A0A377QBB5_9NEIS|nr:GNAT family N-acetyltransferase [Iodobacter fluviatilis]TCU88767.1 RimJ/RimL family protein N-acetyltransferase [Iodobacter fluviatilis]STQ91161.1 Putative ribosomal N-acetyltransferase YdaF [Iodobacter fluviatilis]